MTAIQTHLSSFNKTRCHAHPISGDGDRAFFSFDPSCHTYSCACTHMNLHIRTYMNNFRASVSTFKINMRIACIIALREIIC